MCSTHRTKCQRLKTRSNSCRLGILNVPLNSAKWAWRLNFTLVCILHDIRRSHLYVTVYLESINREVNFYRYQRIIESEYGANCQMSVGPRIPIPEARASMRTLARRDRRNHGSLGKYERQSRGDGIEGGHRKTGQSKWDGRTKEGTAVVVLVIPKLTLLSGGLLCTPLHRTSKSPNLSPNTGYTTENIILLLTLPKNIMPASVEKYSSRDW